MRVKLILPALTEAKSPLFRPIKYSLFPPLGLATLAGYLEEDDEVVLQDEHVETLVLDDDPDLVVIGKPIGGGIPVAAYGMTDEVAARLEGPMLGHDIDVAGVGGTLSGSALAMAAVRATLSTALRQEDFDVSIPLAVQFTDGIREVIAEHDLPWHVQRLGCRAEYWFCPPPRDGAAAAAAVDEELEGFLHLWALNRGVLLTPFHNMALLSPAHTAADVDRHTEVFGEAVAALLG